jgi:hypothetical protein
MPKTLSVRLRRLGKFNWVVALLSLGLTGCSAGSSGTPTCKSNLLPGDLVITEIMANPAGNDEGKEWFEIFNASKTEIDLSGVKVSAGRADGSGELFHVISKAKIQAGQYFVLGGILPDVKPEFVNYAYGADLGSLRNSNGRISVECGNSILDRAVYGDLLDGVSKEFDGSGVPDALTNDNLEAWCDATIEYEPGSFGTPGAPNEPCGGSSQNTCNDGGTKRDVVAPQPGDLFIAEFMADPDGVSDTFGEWFEIYVENGIDLNGLELGTVPGTVKMKVNSADCLAVPAKSYVLFARTLESSTNGGLPTPDVQFNFGLSNSGPGLFVGYDGQILDALTYSSSWAGASTSLDPTKFSPADNDVASNWCKAKDAYGTTGNLGTPKAANPSCGIIAPGECLDHGTPRNKVSPKLDDLIINEFMANPEAGIDDPDGEWFEVVATSDVDLNGLLIGRDPANVTPTTSLILPEGECLHFAAGSFILFARKSDAATNGGLPTVNVAFGFSLLNTSGGLFLGMDGTTLDQIQYSSSTAGASTSLDPAHMSTLDNNDPNNWCPARLEDTYGTGNRGTPKAENPSCL